MIDQKESSFYTTQTCFRKRRFRALVDNERNAPKGKARQAKRQPANRGSANDDEIQEGKKKKK